MSRGTQTIFGMAGVVLPFAGAAAPEGWLLCNGQAVSRTSYAHLFTVIGTAFGVGNGTTTFNMPDLRGEFIRGLDAGRGVDAGRALGTSQADEFKSHDHSEFGKRYELSAAVGTNAILHMGAEVSGLINTDVRGGAETRPRNVAMNHIIKA